MNLPLVAPGEVPASACPTRERLSRALARLQGIQLVRNHTQNPQFGKSAETRIIWRELLDLELQNIDEQFDYLRRRAVLVQEEQHAESPISK